MQIDGQCHCGFISYRATIDPQRVSICHCTDCQTMTGSPYRVTVLTPVDTIEMTGGAPKVYVKRGDNGLNRLQHFCGDCGSPMFASGDGRGQRVGDSLGQHPPARRASATTSNLVPVSRTLDS